VISQANIHFFEKAKAKKVFCPDPDEQGRDAFFKLAKNFKGYLIDLGYDKDPDEILAEFGIERFKEIAKNSIERAQYYLEVMIDKIENNESIREVLTEVIDLDPLDTETWLKRIKIKTGKPLGVLRKELEVVSKKLQSNVGESAQKETSTVEEFTKQETEKAEELLKSNDILARFLKLTNRAGFVGEGVNLMLLFLAFTSRIIDDSISIIIKGASASGKNALAAMVLRTMPKDLVLSFSFLTPKALVHSLKDLSHKILFIMEHAGGESADYAIRTTISEKEISIFIPIKDPETGDFVSVEKRIPATGLVFCETTTRERVHSENQTRVFDLFMNESKEQTEEIIRKQADGIPQNVEKEVESEFKIFRCAQTFLNPFNVVIPYAKELVSAFPRKKVRERRDFPRFLSLIKIHAILYQRQRKIVNDNTMEACLDDLEAILPIVEEVLEQSLRELSPNQVKVLKWIYEDEDFEIEKEFTVKAISTKVSHIVTYKTTQRYLKFFVSEGLLSWNGEKGTKSKYILEDYIDSNVLMSQSSPIVSKLRKILEELKKNLGQHQMPPDVPMSSSQSITENFKANEDIKDISGQIAMSQSKSNIDSGLDQKKGDKDIRTSDIKQQKEYKEHSESCDCRECVPSDDGDLLEGINAAIEDTN